MRRLTRIHPFDWCNYLFLALLGLACVLPLVQVLAVSLSDKSAATANAIFLLPVDLQWNAYEHILGQAAFHKAFAVAVWRALAGTAVNMLLVLLAAYPLSMEREELKGRNVFVWVLFLPMLFSGGLIPTYLLMRDLDLLNSYWALIINPTVVPVFSVIILLNFFRRLPKALAESAMLDGANHWIILTRIYIPLSKASIATLVLFSVVMHWNEWFMGLIYLNDTTKYPLQTYLHQSLLQINYNNITKAELEMLATLSDRTLKSAQIFISMVPIFVIYPFLQKHFTKGIVLGAVKQ